MQGKSPKDAEADDAGKSQSWYAANWREPKGGPFHKGGDWKSQIKGDQPGP